MKRFIVAVIILAIFGVGVHFAYRFLVAGGLRDAKRSPHTAKVSRQTIRTELRVVGEVQPGRQVEVRSEVSGLTAEVCAEIGQTVKKGKLLVRLDEKLLLNKQKQLNLELANTKLRAERAEREYKSMSTLESEGKGILSRNEVLNMETEFKIATNNIELLNMRMREVNENLRKVRIVSPIDGIVLDRNVEEGEVVTGVGGLSNGAVLMKIADLDKLIIESLVNEADLLKINVGDEGRAESYTADGLSLRCRVQTIYPVAEKAENGSRTFKMKVELLERDKRIRPGMSAAVVFPLDQAVDVLAVPVQAIFEKERTDGLKPGKVVYRSVPDQPEPEAVDVKVGLCNAKHCQILDGLSEGDVVWLERPGEKEPAVPKGKVKKGE